MAQKKSSINSKSKVLKPFFIIFFSFFFLFLSLMIISGEQNGNKKVRKRVNLNQDKTSLPEFDLLKEERWLRQRSLPSKGKVLTTPGSVSIFGVKTGTPAKEDVFEPNNTFGEAATLTAGTYQDLACNDDDWYKINVPAGKYLQVLIVKPYTWREISCTFYDHTQTSLKELVWIRMDRMVVLGSLSAGDYYLKVFPQDIYRIGSLYDLEIEFNDATDYGSISGHVTNGSSSDIENVTVEVYDLVGQHLDSVNTNSSGNYTVTNLPASDYILYFNPTGVTGDYAYEWYDNQTSFEKADSVAVMAGFISANKDAQLADSGSIEGKVSDSLAANIENVNVRVYDTHQTEVGYCDTDVNGDYEIKFLPSGSYKVEFRADNAGNYVDEWYNNQVSFDDADNVTVTAGSPTTVNAQLAEGGIISGNVSNGTSGVENVQVSAYDEDEAGVGATYTDSSGDYSLTNLSTGDYRLRFRKKDLNYIQEYYNNKFYLGSADSVSVTAGSTTSGINAVLELGGSISGTLRNESGFGVPKASVNALDSNGNFVDGVRPYDTFGNFIIQGLPAGNYKIVIDPTNPNMYGGQNYMYQWYNNASTFSDAQVVTVSAGAETKGIHVELSSNGGIIKGRITNGLGEGVRYRLCNAVVLNNPGIKLITCYPFSNISDKNGFYEMRGIGPGTYISRATRTIDDGYAIQVYNGVYPWEEGTQINISAGQTVTGIDFELTQGCKISGRLTDSFGTGLKNVIVAPYDATSNRYLGGNQVQTDKEGYYTLVRVRPGQTKIIFSASMVESSQYACEFYDNQSSIGTATIIDVPAGGTMTGIDAVLSTGGGTISGYVKNPQGNPIIEAKVNAHISQDTFVGWDSTDENGYFEIKGLLPGSYKLYSTYWEDIFPTDFYSDKTDYDSADTVVVTEAGTTPVHIVLGGPDHGVTVTSPNGSEDWTINTTQNITWTTFGLPKNLYIVLQQNGTNVALLGKNIDPALGTFAWKVGDSLKGAVTAGANFKIRLTDKNVQDKSDDVFTISDPFVTVTSPNGGENWTTGNVENITWTAAGLSNTLYIILQQNGTNVALIDKNIDPALGTYAWTVGDCRIGTAVAGANYKIVIKEKDSTVKDNSDASFTIL